MTDFIDLLTSMSSKFNETNADLQINLNEDKTLKWRGLHNNQYAAVKKRKDIKRSEKAVAPNTSSTTATTTTTTTATATTTDDDPPLMNDSVSVTVNADDVATAADVTKSHDIDSIVVVESSQTTTSEKSEENILTGNDTKSVSVDKMEKINNDKEKDDDQRPFRRTLRRKQNADETTNADDSSGLNADRNRKIGLRPKRQSSAGSASENRSVSPRGGDKEEKSIATIDTVANRKNIMTRQRGRAKKTSERESSVEVQSKSAADESNDSLPKTRGERKNSLANEVDDGQIQPTLPKLRRSERMHTSTPSDQKLDQTDAQGQPDDRNKSETDGIEHKSNADKEHATRSRKRTVDDKKPTDYAIETKDEKSFDDKSVPSEIEVDTKYEDEVKIEDEKNENSQKVVVDDVEMIDAPPAPADTNHDQDQSNSSDSNVVARKRGRKPGAAKGKGNLKLNMTIATRNSPVKKSPRLNSDESPFVYTIPKKDKAAAEQVSNNDDHFCLRINCFCNIYFAVLMTIVSLSK